jgi:hypothetical protein
MVTDAHRDAARIEELTGVVRVHAVDVERPEPDARRVGVTGACGIAEQADAGDLGESRAHALGERDLVRVDALEADAVEVADGCGESDRRSDRLRARLEPLRRGRYCAPSSVTVVIIDPPVRNGGIDSSTSARP